MQPDEKEAPAPPPEAIGAIASMEPHGAEVPQKPEPKCVKTFSWYREEKSSNRNA